MVDKKQVTAEELNKIAQDALTSKDKQVKIGRVSFAYTVNSECQDALEIEKRIETIHLLVKTRQIYYNRKYYPMDDKTYALASPLLRRIIRRQKWQKFWNKHGGAVLAFGVCGTALTAILIFSTLEGNKRPKTEAKTPAYEKTVQGALEQKQQVEQWRDSSERVYGN